MAILLIAGSFVSLSRQKNFWEHYSKDLEATVNDAHNVKKDLELLMENAIAISQTITDNIEIKALQKQPEESVSSQEQNPQSVINDISSQICDISTDKIRVYKLAEELGIDSKTLINMLHKLGYKVTNQLNTVDTGAVDTIQKMLLQERKQQIAEEMITQSIKAIDTDAGSLDTTIPLVNNNSNSGKKMLVESSVILSDTEDVWNGIDFNIDELKSAHPYIAVRNLYARGYSIKQIAKLLDRGQGEVHLLLNLAEKSKAM